jgi:hypothetical protein
MKNKKTSNKLPYVICRCRDAGVHAGELLSDGRDKVILTNSRRLWYWTGAATLSELAVYGSKIPEGCKFPPEVAHIKLRASDVCEIIYCQPAGEKMIRECWTWRA